MGSTRCPTLLWRISRRFRRVASTGSTRHRSCCATMPLTWRSCPLGVKETCPLDTDPKLAWAQTHLLENPVEVNAAERHLLLRVPGIGPTTADRIVQERRKGRLTDVSDLRRLGIVVQRAMRFRATRWPHRGPSALLLGSRHALWQFLSLPYASVWCGRMGEFRNVGRQGDSRWPVNS